MSIYNLDRFFKPGSVAVIGASEKPGSIGAAIMQNLQAGSFAGRIIPVNPKYKRIGDLKVLNSIREISEEVDLAVIATPIATVPALIDMCAEVGIGAAVILSAGGKEIGEQGRKIETKIQALAAQHKIRVIGPNCLGLIVPGRHLNTSFAAGMPLSGKLGFVSQSGAICTSILDLALKERIGFSHFVSIGSMIDVDFGDVIDYLGYQSDVGSILLYIESLTNIRKFMSAARSVAQTKPIIALKAGRSSAGAKVAASHTGALAGEDEVYEAAFRRAGIIRVNSILDLFDCAELIAKQPLPRGSRLGIISNGGGPAVLAADAMSMHGAEPEPLTQETSQALNKVLPGHWNRNNPIDILGDASVKRFADAIDTCRSSRNFDALMVMFAPQAVTDAVAVAEALTSQKQTGSIPMIACWMGGRDVSPAIERLNLAGVPTYDSPERAVRAFLYMVQYVRNLELLRQVPPRFSRQLDFNTERVRGLIANSFPGGNRFLTEITSKAILEAYGINVNPTILATHVRDALQKSEQIGFPLVMKIVSPDITHKSEVKGIKLDLRSKAEVDQAFREIAENAKVLRPGAQIEGVALQPYIPDADYELLMGAKQDPSFGPVMVFGLGGIFTEVVKDCKIGLPPMNRLLARRLMQETRAFKLLSGYRNRTPADIESLEEMLVRLSQLLIDFPEIKEADLNPVVVKGGRPVAVDARILLGPPSVNAPLHLVISPYPAQYEYRSKIKDGEAIFIRPIRPEDGPLFQGLFESLSTTSLYFRFCCSIKALSSDMLARNTQIDYDREMALVAIKGDLGSERMLGAARFINDPDGRSAEFAVMVGDAWQGKGIGALLLQKLLLIGCERRLESIWGYVLAGNTGMLRLGKTVGFKSTFSSEVGMYVLKINLSPSLKTDVANLA
ncbi:MAG: bifunctional acetate--CoA ligase family protein/GNAT family N-acetyltransferase [Desulfobacterales bacterium]|jgi:acetyltransferase